VRGKRAADLHHAEMKAKLATGGVAASSERGKTVRALMEEILAARPNLAVNSVRAYGNTTRLHIYPALGDLKVRQLRSLTLTGFFERVEKDAGREARRRAESMMRDLLKVAVREGIIDRNPLDGVPFPKRSRVRGVPYAPELVDAARVREHIATQRRSVMAGEAEMALAWHDVLVGTGVRVGELLAISPEVDIDFARKTLRISRQLIYVPNEGFIFKGPKNDESARTIPLPQFVLSSIATTQLRNGLREITLPWDEPDSGKLVTVSMLFFSLRTPGKPLGPQQVADRLARVGRLVGLPGALHPHSYRHRYTTELHDAGVPQIVIDEITGHKPHGSLTLTTYTQATEQGRAKARESIETAWSAALAERAGKAVALEA
jgi:integrase